MGVILDTSVLVAVERGQITEDDVRTAIGSETTFCTPVTVAELQYGVARARGDVQRKRRQVGLALIKDRPCLAMDRRTGEVLGALVAALASRGRASGQRMQDLWIASLAIQHGHKILTLNARDFEDIPGIEVITLP